MNSVSNKKFSSVSSRTTSQEFKLNQIFIKENIPFQFQKIFSFSDHYYIVDFFIDHSIILECSYTQSFSHHIALRHKAKLLESKFSNLKSNYMYPIWVLFESERLITPRFIQTLKRFMPSVDQIFTSILDLREKIQVELGIIRNCELRISNLHTLNCEYSSFNKLKSIDSNFLIKNRDFPMLDVVNQSSFAQKKVIGQFNYDSSLFHDVNEVNIYSQRSNLIFQSLNHQMEIDPIFLDGGIKK